MNLNGTNYLGNLYKNFQKSPNLVTMVVMAFCDMRYKDNLKKCPRIGDFLGYLKRYYFLSKKLLYLLLGLLVENLGYF